MLRGGESRPMFEIESRTDLEQVPADGVLIAGHSLSIDESSMTGESKIVRKYSREPFLMSGSKVADGNGIMLVAKRFVETALNYSTEIFIGNGPQGLFDHLMSLKNNIHKSAGQVRFFPDHLFLYAITDSGIIESGAIQSSDAVKAVVEGGATIVQLRTLIKTVALLLHLLMRTSSFVIIRNMRTKVLLIQYTAHVVYIPPNLEP